MDDCEQILREIYPYLDAELSDEARVEIQGHLDDCLDCLHVYDFHAELRMVIAAKCRERTVPPGLLAKVRECLGVDAEGSASDEAHAARAESAADAEPARNAET